MQGDDPACIVSEGRSEGRREGGQKGVGVKEGGRERKLQRKVESWENIGGLVQSSVRFKAGVSGLIKG